MLSTWDIKNDICYAVVTSMENVECLEVSFKGPKKKKKMKIAEQGMMRRKIIMNNIQFFALYFFVCIGSQCWVVFEPCQEKIFSKGSSGSEHADQLWPEFSMRGASVF